MSHFDVLGQSLSRLFPGRSGARAPALREALSRIADLAGQPAFAGITIVGMQTPGSTSLLTESARPYGPGVEADQTTQTRVPVHDGPPRYETYVLNPDTLAGSL